MPRRPWGVAASSGSLGDGKGHMHSAVAEPAEATHGKKGELPSLPATVAFQA